MHNSTPLSTSSIPQSQPQSPNPVIPDFTSAISSIPNDPTSSSSLFNWSDFLDFDLDDPFSAITFDSDQPTTAPEPVPVLTSTEDAGRIRKRDQRLVCPNFLAGRIPCACPELDAMLEQEEELLRGDSSGKKRARSLRAPPGSTARCQVPECEADISELKGYHKRHRVCLRCAHASTVVLDGQDKRYCQQCGKFHILSDFDEGKRSCRRKLERHNNRRRRKPADGKGAGEKESQLTPLSEDVSIEDDMSKDSLCLSSQIVDKEPLLESEGLVSTLGSAHDPDKIQGDGVASFVAYGETQIDGEKEHPKSDKSLSYDDNKSAFSSACDTGRISFKLYDWNPAEFPRRLRHQIFEWLASMPVELEGYIRPGCTILTMYIAMPKIMWVKLSEEPAVHLHNLVISPGNLLSGRMNFLAYLNNMIFSIVETKGETSVVQLNVKEQVPKLHYVHPTCFEAGRPLEFVACGSNLLQPRFRFLLSFAGKYLASDFSVLSHENTGDGSGTLNHQLVKVSVRQKDPNLFGPAFVEVENDSGLSNFIPILIADKEICAEMKTIEQRLDALRCSGRLEITSSCSLCQVSVLRQAKLSELITEVGWFVKNPVLENMRPWTRTRIERTDKLLNFLIESESTATLDRVLYSLNNLMDNKVGAGALDAEMKRLQMSMHNARLLVYQKLNEKDNLIARSLHQNYSVTLPVVLPSMLSQVAEAIATPLSDRRRDLSTESAPLLSKEATMRINVKERPLKSCAPLLTKTVFTYRPFVLVITGATVCIGLCAALLHPQKVGELAVTVRRCIST